MVRRLLWVAACVGLLLAGAVGFQLYRAWGLSQLTHPDVHLGNTVDLGESKLYRAR